MTLSAHMYTTIKKRIAHVSRLNADFRVGTFTYYISYSAFSTVNYGR